MNETIRRTISIRKLPQQLDRAHQKDFYRELESHINVDRPSVVLDCSQLSRLDRNAIHLLLCCLEEAMKRNGDVRLAALQPEPLSVLHSTGLDSIFQVFDSVENAVESFRAPRISLLSPSFSTSTSAGSTQTEDRQVNAA
jgi:anti-anti-sigma factor